jgi:PAS domain S-box-containing protein
MFTQYAGDPYGLSNMVGHLLRIVAYYLVYVAIVKNSLQRPYDVLFRELSKTAAALRDSEVRFRSTFEQATLGISHISLDGRYLAANQRLAEITGYQVEDLEGMRSDGITHPDDRDTEKRLTAKMEAGEIDDYRLEKRLVRRDGTDVWVNTARVVVHDAEGAPRYIVAIDEDITTRKSTEVQQKRARELGDALNSIDRTVLASFDTDTILQRVIEAAGAALDASAAAVLDRTAGQTVVRRVHRMDPAIVGEVIPSASDGPSATALSMAEPFMIGSLEDAVPATRDWMKERGYNAMLAVPLLFRDDEIGSLTFLFADPVPEFGEAEMDFARKLSGVVSIAMENARLYAAEANIADVLQTSLIGAPQDVEGLEIAHAYYSATELTKIGGDFYDVFQVDPETIAFALGDVSGKGLEAATLTAMAKSTLRAFAYRDATPSAVLGSANDVIAEQLGDGRFITAVFGTIHMPTGDVKMACAGHPAPIRCGNPSCEEEPIVRNLPLGVFEEATFEYYETKIEIGDVLVLYSDGLIDARRGTDLLGEERVREILVGMGFDVSPQKVVDDLLEAARAHSEGSPPDDITILAMRYRGAK